MGRASDEVRRRQLLDADYNCHAPSLYLNCQGPIVVSTRIAVASTHDMLTSEGLTSKLLLLDTDYNGTATS